MNEEVFENLKQGLEPLSTEISEASLCDDSEEVAVYISGYICNLLNSKTKCEGCMILRGSETDTAVGPSSHYSQFLSRCGLSMPSYEIKHYVCNSFAIVDLVEDTLLHVF